ncbi:MAG: hypothetical protein AAFY41_18510, partial [Bacteroidota bacterium]
MKKHIKSPNSKKSTDRSSYISGNEIYDSLTRLAHQLCKVKYSIVGVVEEGIVIIKSQGGEEVGKNPKEVTALLEKTLENKTLTEISYESDAEDKKQVTGFFAGLPVKNKDGDLCGIVAVLDNQSQSLSVEQKIGLEIIGNQVLGVLELEKGRQDYLTLVESSHDMIYEIDSE